MSDKEIPLGIQRTVALFGLLGHTGVKDIEVGWLNEEKPYEWWAKGNWDGHRVYSEGHLGADDALDEIAKQVVHNGQCVKCERKLTFGFIEHGKCSRVLVMPESGNLEFQRLCDLVKELRVGVGLKTT
jgi:hypothetical protein